MLQFLFVKMVKTRSDQTKSIDADVEKFQKELVERVMAGLDRSVEKVMVRFNQSPVTYLNAPSKEKPSSSKSSIAGHWNAESEKLHNLVPLASILPTTIIPFVPLSVPNAFEKLSSTPQGSPISGGSMADAPVSPPPATPTLGKGQPSSPTAKPPETIEDQVFDEMPQRDSPPNLMKSSVRPGFPSWASRFFVYQKGIKPWNTTRLAKKSVPQPSLKKHSRSSSDESFNPLFHSPGDEEEMEAEQVLRPKPQPKKKKQQKKNEVSLKPSTVTRSKARSQDAAPNVSASSKGKSSKTLLVIPTPLNSSQT